MIPFEMTARRCAGCGELAIEGVTTCAVCGASPRGEPFFYSLPLSKLALLGATTFGIYLLYWFWSQWRAEAPNDGRLSTAFKTVFAGIFFYSIASSAKDEAEKHGVSCRYSPALLTVVLLSLFFVDRVLPEWAVILSLLLLPLPFLPVQALVNRVNAATVRDQQRPWRRWQKVSAGVLVVFWALIVLGLLLPEPSEERVGDGLAQVVPPAPTSHPPAKNLTRM